MEVGFTVVVARGRQRRGLRKLGFSVCKWMLMVVVFHGCGGSATKRMVTDVN
ncbi:hypothetical protein LR48_Vigan03g032500 [Vigna angularis]|uniref:Uncharacterized protein n=1 Tax=Phaseolus angularis TaxID=3914 RepID=A0A0L9U3J4_PHAAN|nr:hypothetical protein LR48_Vigan03g032500 [Vigna angularis]